MSAGIRARCNSLSSRLVQCWNRRTAVEQELAHHDIDAERRAYLEERLRALTVEQATLEQQMTKASVALLGALADGKA